MSYREAAEGEGDGVKILELLIGLVLVWTFLWASQVIFYSMAKWPERMSSRLYKILPGGLIALIRFGKDQH